MKNFIKEFKEFAMRGNVLDMAIGVIIAGAFGKITASLINDVLMPFISFVCGTRDMTALNVIVRAAELDAEGNVVKEAITLGFGTLLATILDFILVAFVVFLIVKAMNKMKKKEEPAPEPEPEPEEPKPTAEELLAEIRDLLKDKE